MNFITFIWLFGIFLFGLAVGVLTWERHGALWGVLAGFLAWACAVLLVQAGRWSFSFLDRINPSRPLCQRGKCKDQDYEFIGWNASHPLFRCGCGDEYLRSRNAFLRITPDGKAQRFMIRRKGKWQGPLSNNKGCSEDGA